MGITAAVRYERTVDQYAGIATGRLGRDAGIAVYVISDNVIDNLTAEFTCDGRDVDMFSFTPADWKYARQTFLYYLEDHAELNVLIGGQS